jgi:L-asparaginase/Glu-tRNA(Gln) amidotransferase subunit D
MLVFGLRVQCSSCGHTQVRLKVSGMRTTLIATGGTIAWNGELARMLTASELLAAAGDGVEEVVDLGPVPSWDLSVEDMAVIAAHVGAAHIPSPYHSIVERLVGRGVPVVLATRCRDVDRSPDSQALVLYAGDVTAEKAAIALRVGLDRHRYLAGLRTWWARLLAAGRSDGGSLPSHGLGRK